MKTLPILFWLSFAVIFYSFIGYGIIVWIMVAIKKRFTSASAFSPFYQPEVTLVIPCYNEAGIIASKIGNCMELDYPANKLSILFITDGSTDGSEHVLAKYPSVINLHISRRGGKTAAENRAMQHVKTPIVLFSDANTVVNPMAVKNIVRHFANSKVGCVAGEKRIITKGADVASAAGEGIYWKYESLLKKLDSQLYSAVGAAGELVAFRSKLYETIPEDTILDDFMQSMLIASKGYTIVYEPEAFACETAAASVKEELKRKVRICAGGWQSIKRLSSRLTIKKQPLLFFQYLSHRVLRWTVNPFLLVIMLLVSVQQSQQSPFYRLALLAQVAFYGGALLGYLLEKRHLKIKALFIPYYFCVMNYAVIAGLIRFLKGGQSAIWEKNERMAAA